jgi:hypothetical protein
MVIPFWLKLSTVIALGILYGIWFAGEATRKLDSDYLLATIHRDMQRTTTLLAGLIAEPIVTGDTGSTEATIYQYVEGWSEITYVHVLDENGYFVTDWKKNTRSFGPGIYKFEQVIEHGGQNFGILSVYADMNPVYSAVDQHISSSRRQSGFLLLSITMFIVFFVNFFALKGIRVELPTDD